MKYCPMCLKNGLRRKVKAFQVNFEEALWSCEAENCPWPINYEEMIFFQRDAFTCNWEEELSPPVGISEENIPISMELLLYTPPVTPGGELSKESTDSTSVEYSLNSLTENKPDETLLKNKVICSTKELLESQPALAINKLEINNVIEERNNTRKKNTNANICKTSPKIIDIQNTQFDKKLLSKYNQCRNKRKHKPLPIDVTVMNITENISFDNILCKEIELDTQCKINKQNKNSEGQLDDKINGAETNLDTKMLLETDKSSCDVNDKNNQNSTNNSQLNTLDISSNIDKILEDILNTNNSDEYINDDWLLSLTDT